MDPAWKTFNFLHLQINEGRFFSSENHLDDEGVGVRIRTQ